MTAPSKRSGPRNLVNTRRSTSLLASGDGPSLSDSQDGRTVGPCGRDLVRASRSVGREPGTPHRRTTLDISGRTCEGSSKSASLQSALESRLRARLGGGGSKHFDMTWRHWDMKSGPRICALRARARITSGSESSGLLRTPTASDNRDRGAIYKNPSITRRITSGKQIGLSMLFDGAPCPFCVTAMMGFPQQWLGSLCTAWGTR